MKVNVFCRGWGHSIELAQQLHRYGVLERIVSGYPRFKLRTSQIPSNKISMLGTALLNQGVMRIPLCGHHLIPRVDYWNRRIFHSLARRYLKGCDVAFMWMHDSPALISDARKLGVKTVLECGAVHSGFMKNILQQEYERRGLPFNERDSAIFFPPSLQGELSQYEEADFIQVPSDFVRQSFLQSGIGAEKLLKASCGTDSRMFKPAPKNDHKFRAMYVGLVSLLKGVPVLLEAWRRLKWNKNIELTLVGRVSPELSPMLSKPISGLKLLGSINHWDLPKIYSQASVFVFPTWGDGWPRVVGEAMACGLPVICTPNSGACEMIREGTEGFIVPPGDPEAIAERISLLRDNEELRREMAAAARRRAEFFSWDRFGEKVMENLYSVLANHTSKCIEV